MAVLLVAGLLALSFLAFPTARHPTEGILGGPAARAAELSLGSSTPTDTLGAFFAGERAVDTQGASHAMVAGAIFDTSIPQGNRSPEKGVTAYAVKKGDTLSSIAADLTISLATLIQANPSIRSRSLKVGESLTILPVSGALHVVRADETIESIADLYGVAVQKILEVNPGVRGASLAEGTRIAIPGAQPDNLPRAALAAAPVATLASASSLPENYFIMPTQGFNWGILHGNNGVDIANRCGTPVVAAADGLVTPFASCEGDEGWNGGYGTCLVLQHPGTVSTLYAHLMRTVVAIGDYVKKGETIGLMGSTGKSSGCHLHFEVHGAPNPFAKY